MRAVAAVLLALAALVTAPPAAGQPAGSNGVDPEALRLPTVTDAPPPGRRRSAREVLGIAEALPKVRRERAGRHRTYTRAYLKGADRWQVGVWETGPGQDEEIAQVIVDDRTGRVLEQWTGIQVAWTMARGYPGAFGREAGALYVWIPLLALFLLPYLRRPWRLLHLDLAVLCAFSVSWAFFDAAEIGTAVALAYPLLGYLLVRMLVLARNRGRGDRDPPPLRLLVSPAFLGFAVVFLLGFRLGMNINASNVIDVGYAGVVGADRITSGEALYGGFPADNAHGDTYGPLNYYAYAPFELALPWSGRWDDLPAAHAAAVAFDLGCAGALWLLGRRLRGPLLGLLLAYGWMTFPFTLLVANSNANDALVGLLVLVALLVATRPVARGAAVAAAGLAKFAPLALGPLMLRGTAPRPQWGVIAGGTLAAAVLLAPVALLDGGLGTFAERSVGFQLGRESPFSLWGMHGWTAAQRVVQAGAVLLVLALAVWPRRRDLVGLCALSAAALIALQLGVTHWFHFYLAWFVGPLLAALLAPVVSEAGAAPARSTAPGPAPEPG